MDSIFEKIREMDADGRQMLYGMQMGEESARVLVETPHLEEWFLGFAEQAAENEEISGLQDEMLEAIKSNPEIIRTLADKDQDFLDNLSGVIEEDPGAFSGKIAEISQDPEQIGSILGIEETAGPDIGKDFSGAGAAAASQQPPEQSVEQAASTEGAMPEGMAEFFEKLGEREELRTAFNEILADDADNPDPRLLAEKTRQLSALAQADPDFFVKLNQVVDRPGYDEFLKAAGSHEGLRQVFKDMMGSFNENQEQSIAFLDSIHEHAMQDDRFFPMATEVIETRPGLVNTFVEQFRNNPDEAFSRLDMFSKFMVTTGGMTETLNEVNPQLGGLVDGIVNMFIEILAKIMPLLKEIMQGIGLQFGDALEEPEGERQSGGPPAQQPGAEGPARQQPAAQEDTAAQGPEDRQQPSLPRQQ